MKFPRRKGGSFYAQAANKSLRCTVWAQATGSKCETAPDEAPLITMSSEAAQASVLQPQICHLLPRPLR